jgi:hypothetical protein
VTGAAAVTFILENRRAGEARGARSLGRVIKSSSRRGRPNESADAAARVMGDLPSPFVLTSNCDTWVDRAEAAALRRARGSPTISTIYGHAAEHFSASSLLGIASVLQTGRMPRMLASLSTPPPNARVADGSEHPQSFAAICTDFTGCVSGVLISMG